MGTDACWCFSVGLASSERKLKMMNSRLPVLRMWFQTHCHLQRLAAYTVNPIGGRFLWSFMPFRYLFNRIKTNNHTLPIQFITDACKTEQFWWDRTVTRPGGLTLKALSSRSSGWTNVDGGTLTTTKASGQKRQKGQDTTLRNLYETFWTLLCFCESRYISDLRSLPRMILWGH